MENTINILNEDIEKFPSKLVKYGGSYFIRFPPMLINLGQYREGDLLDIVIKKKIQKNKKRYE
jgi:hypothetical protein